MFLTRHAALPNNPPCSDMYDAEAFMSGVRAAGQAVTAEAPPAAARATTFALGQQAQYVEELRASYAHRRYLKCVCCTLLQTVPEGHVAVTLSWIACVVQRRSAGAPLPMCCATPLPGLPSARLDCPSFRVPADWIVKHEALVFAALAALRPAGRLASIVGRCGGCVCAVVSVRGSMAAGHGQPLTCRRLHGMARGKVAACCCLLW